MRKVLSLFLTIAFAASFVTAQGQELKTFHYACPGDKDDPEITYTGYEDELGNITKHGQYKWYGISVNFKNGKLDGIGTIAQGKTTATLKYVNDKLVSIDYVEKGTGNEIIIFKYSLDDNGLLKGNFEYKQISSYDNSLIKGKFDDDGKATGWWEVKFREDKEVSKKYYEHGYCLGTDDNTIETSRAYFIDKKLTEKELRDKGFYVITDNPEKNAEIWIGNAINMVQDYLCGRKYGHLEKECLNLHFKNTFNLKNIFNHTSLGGSPITYMSAELYQNIVDQIKEKNIQTTLSFDDQIDKYYALKADRVSRLYIPVEYENDFKDIIRGKNSDYESCGELTDYDGNTYQTLKIGSQCWMKENLRTTHYANGGSISLGPSDNNFMGCRYYPNGKSSSVSMYGYLYDWKAVMRFSSSSSANPSGVQGVCPNGWHVPSSSEWEQLTDYVSSQSQYVCGDYSSHIAKSLSSFIGWESCSTICGVGYTPGSNNATGFSALPAGGYYNFVNGDNEYRDFGKEVNFWSSKESDSDIAVILHFYYGDTSVKREYSIKKNGFSVRCLRD